jgi:hypothetical protein
MRLSEPKLDRSGRFIPAYPGIHLKNRILEVGFFREPQIASGVDDAVIRVAQKKSGKP